MYPTPSQEHSLISLFITPSLGWSKALTEQIKSAEIKREYLHTSFFVDFKVNPGAERIPVQGRVPLMVAVGKVEVAPEKTVCVLDGHSVSVAGNHRPLEENVYIVQLHFADGYLIELEAYTFGWELDFAGIESREHTYFVKDESVRQFLPGARVQ